MAWNGAIGLDDVKYRRIELADKEVDFLLYANTQRQLLLANYVEHGRLIGRVVDVWNNNRHVRNPQSGPILALETNIENWWNRLPPELKCLPGKAKDGSCSNQDNGTVHSAFFIVMYHQLVILMNRPLLSLHSRSPEFSVALQKCVGAARGTILALQRHVGADMSIFSPVFVSVVWMAGLIIAYACQIGQHTGGMGRK